MGPVWTITSRSGCGGLFAALSSYVRDRSGLVIIKFALVLPVLLGIVAGLIDYARIQGYRATLQAAADAAAMAGAKELSLVDARSKSVAAVVGAVATRYVQANEDQRATGHAPAVVTNVTREPLMVDVTVRGSINAIFGPAFGLDVSEIEVRSIARVVGKPNICMLALEPQAGGALDLSRNARITGENCAIFSNSKSTQGIKSQENAVLTATAICTAGGAVGGKGNFSPEPITDCPQFDDPLASRPAPAAGACLGKDLKIEAGQHTLAPGTYCGGLTLGGTAIVTLDPGVYVITGDLIVTGSATLTGENVGIYLSGLRSRFVLDTNTTVSLSAPREGEMAGLLFFADRKQNGMTKHVIRSNNARKLLGTIYVAQGILSIDADQPIADQSAYTAIVAQRIEAFAGPHLVLNTNYHASDVPVPEGIKGATQPVTLWR